MGEIKPETPAPKATVRTSGGTPNGFPDYRPLNKLSREEFLRETTRIFSPVLYQVVVEKRTGGSLRVGPKCSQQTASALAGAINTQVALGREQTWANATVITCF